MGRAGVLQGVWQMRFEHKRRAEQRSEFRLDLRALTDPVPPLAKRFDADFIIAGNAHFAFGLSVQSLQLIIPQRPVNALSIKRFHGEIVGQHANVNALPVPSRPANEPLVIADELVALVVRRIIVVIRAKGRPTRIRGDGLPVVSSACFRRFASAPFARPLRFIAAAPPPGRIQPDVNAPMKRRMRPIRRVRHETVLGWVEMRVVHMSRAVAIIADRVLPVPPLPNAASATAGHDQ
jgi:hypothetical protein